MAKLITPFVFALTSDDLRSLCDIRLNFRVNAHQIVELVQVDVDSKYFTDWQELDMARISQSKKDDWLAIGEAWYEHRIRWKKQEYNNDDLEIA